MRLGTARVAAGAGLRPAGGPLRRSRRERKPVAGSCNEPEPPPERRGLVGNQGSPAPSDAVFEALRLWKALELLERVVLDLPDALAGHAERAADLLERARLLALQAEP